MNLRGTIHLGWRYVQRRKRTVGLLVAAITLSTFLPIGIWIVVQDAEAHLRSRSATTPLLLGAPGSPLELVFNGIYFSEPQIDTVAIADAKRVTRDGLAQAIPIYARFEARDHRIVGTTIDYFAFRNLRVAEGRPFLRLGDCVLGAAVAESLGLGPGDRVTSTPEQVFNLAGVYPLKMRVTGVLAPTGQVDDGAIFVDVKTAWVIEGLAHGHDAPEVGDDTVLEERDGNLALNASVVQYTEVTDENVDSFHFHGDPATFPISAAIVVPRDAKAATILLGRYVGTRKLAQLVRPDQVVANLFATVFQIRNLVIGALLAVGLMAAVIAFLVFVLSNRLRAREFASLAYIGAEPGSVRALIAFEAVFVGVTSLALAGLLVLLLELVMPQLLPLLTA